MEPDGCTQMEVRDGQQQPPSMLTAKESRACLMNRFAAPLFPAWLAGLKAEVSVLCLEIGASLNLGFLASL